jgi:alkylation response protein AidB-like acyl-CoA dehydrogenase
MGLLFSDEQEEFRSVVRRFLEEVSPITEVRRQMETSEGFDREVWRRLNDELGLAAIHLPEEYGGQGFGYVELGIVLEEMGRALLCAPYFASVVLAANAISTVATEAQKKEHLPSIASGEKIATLALSEPQGGWGASDIATTATPDDRAYRLDGVKTYVIDGHTADRIVVVARSPGSSGAEGISFFVVKGDADGLERRPLATLDTTRKQARLDLAAVRAELLGELGGGAPALAKTLDLAAVALANEMVGGAEKVLESAVEYAKTRVQFGRPIGSFQAIKHKCADVLLEVELAKSAAYYAAASVAADDDDLPANASLAKALVSDTYMKAAAENIQIHGGVGFTWEDDAHLYFKRAKSSEVFLGDPSYHRELLALRLGV